MSLSTGKTEPKFKVGDYVQIRTTADPLHGRIVVVKVEDNLWVYLVARSDRSDFDAPERTDEAQLTVEPTFEEGERVDVQTVTALPGGSVIVTRTSDAAGMHLHQSEVIGILRQSEYSGTIVKVHGPGYYEVKLGDSNYTTGLKVGQIRKRT